MYSIDVPKLWTETVETHRREVRDAILDTTAALVTEHGLTSMTMSQIAGGTGIGRATLYKYFPDIEAILVAWFERQVSAQLARLAAVRDQAGDAGKRLNAVLDTYALLSHKRHSHGHHSHGHHGTELASLLHRGEHFARAHQQLSDFIRDLLTEAAAAGHVRDDIAPDELAKFCVHALSAATSLPSEEAVRRLVTVTLGGLRAPR